MLVKSYSISPTRHGKSFVPAFFKVSIDHPFDNVEAGKKLLFWKNSGKSLEFWMKNLFDPALITLKGNSKLTSANLLSHLEAQNRDLGAALQTLLIRGILCL